MVEEYVVESGVIRSRCPACKKFVNEGSNHKCPKGRHRNPFINPLMDPNKSMGAK